MKIIRLQAENIKNLKAIDITPDGAVVLEGKNGAGKSAVLESIYMGFTGKKIDEPIRHGEKRAEINIDLGKYKIRRIYTDKSNRLEVTSAEGELFKSPQTLLDSAYGNIGFDPLSFANMDPRTQRALLAKLVGLDFTALNQERQRLYDERTIKNREIKGGDPTSFRPDPNRPLPLEALIGGMEEPLPGTPREEISMAEELGKVEALEGQAKIHEAYEDAKCKLTDHRSACEANIHTAEAEIAELEKRIEAIRDRIKTNEYGIEETNKAIAAMAEPAFISPELIDKTRRGMLVIEETNKAIRKAVEFDKALARLKTVTQEVNKLEERMAKIDLEKQDRIGAAAFPIAGLGLDDETVIYQGKPFSQLSTGEQIRISTAIAMALNPELRVIIVREGSLLDQKGMEEIIALAKDKDYQLWIERVADNQQVGIYLEEGEIKNA
jgi:ABC-type dipeptide/oligopeptide/nickel transport system ATPase subunit